MTQPRSARFPGNVDRLSRRFLGGAPPASCGNAVVPIASRATARAPDGPSSGEVQVFQAGGPPVTGDWGPLLTTLRDAPPASLGENLPGRFRLVSVGTAVIPLLEVSGEQPAAWACSIVSRHVHASVVEVRKLGRPVWLGVVSAQAALSGWLLARLGVERAVFINNWLRATNPAPGVSAEELARLKDWLIAEYPDRALIYPTVNPVLEPELSSHLRRAGARLIPTRIVHLLDPRENRFHKSSDVKRDRRLLRHTPYRIIGREDGGRLDLDRVTQLYRRLYVEKHGESNAAFGRRYLEALLESPAVQWAVFENPDRGTIDMFTLWTSHANHLTKVMGAYDQTLPRTTGLYRMQIMYPVFHAAEPAGLPINLSGGAEHFKRLRGARPVMEYDAVWDDHLPPWRRIPWRLLEGKGRWNHRHFLRTKASPGGAVGS